MVLISLKSALGAPSHGDGFLYETTAATAVDDLLASLVDIHNARIRARLVADGVRGLAARGAAARPERGGAEGGRAPGGAAAERGPDGAAEPSDAPTAARLAREVRALEDYVDKQQVQRKVALTLAGIEERLERVRGAVAAAHPGGLPAGDARRALEAPPAGAPAGTRPGAGRLDAADAALWTCGRPWPRGRRVSDRLGSRNEKTTVVATLTAAGAGAPAREPVVREAERAAMSALHFRRQEELKRLAGADDDDYLGADWADPRGMQRSLQGLDDVKAPGLRF